MNANDLLNALRGATVTINIQSGNGTMYTGPVQNNNYSAQQSKPQLRCYICGRSDEYVHTDMFGDVHPACIQRGREEALRIAEAQSRWQVIRHAEDELLNEDDELEEIESIESAAPLQITAPKRYTIDDLFCEIEKRYSGRYAELVENGQRYGMSK